MDNIIYHDPRFTFGWWQRSDPAGTCDLKVFRTKQRTVVAVFSDLVKPNGECANGGTSITNAIEFAATKVRTEVGIVPDVWIEFYPDRGWKLDLKQAHGHPPQFQEEFAYVHFKGWYDGMYRHPDWLRVNRSDVEELLGQRFEYEYVDEDVV